MLLILLDIILHGVEFDQETSTQRRFHISLRIARESWNIFANGLQNTEQTILRSSFVKEKNSLVENGVHFLQ